MSSNVCRFFAQGNCRYGKNCRFAHPDAAGGFPNAPRGGGHERVWITSPAAALAADAGVPLQGPTIRVLCWNTLSDRLAYQHRRELYPGVPSAILSYRSRGPAILNTLRQVGPAHAPPSSHFG